VKAFLLLLALASLPACTKKNDAETLRHEAIALAKFYSPRLDALQQRVTEIIHRGGSIPATAPGVADLNALLGEASESIVQMRGIVAPGPDGKSAVEKQADAAARDGKIMDLRKLVHDTESTLERRVTIIDSQLSSVESWISYFQNEALAGMDRAGEQPLQPPMAATTSPSTTGQPPAAAQPTPAAPGGAQPPPAAPGR
jgi:hypothetical protein